MRTAKEKLTTILSLFAGITYSSWPLGYVLNPKVARSSLASGLEAPGQPYNWVFIGADVVSSVLVIAACVLLWQSYRKVRMRKPILVGLFCTTLFGIGTILAAVLPEHCVPNLMVCPSFTQDHFLLVHGASSIVASLALFIALLILWYQKRTSSLLLGLLVAYVIFGAISLMQALVPSGRGNWSQDYYMTLCSVLLISLPACVAVIAPSKKLQVARVKRTQFT
ncbi:MAG TPA: DUF998 domain-containing protein [Candidatus Saccharimonadia bacterium]|nr:DUF998 domain-containing protein [Candidatus Saccharimonadia bacterium]